MATTTAPNPPAQPQPTAIRDRLGIKTKKKSDTPPVPKTETPPAVIPPPPQKPDEPVKPAPVDTSAISAAVASGVKEALKPAPETKLAPPDKLEGFTPAEKRRFQVFERMEKLDSQAAGIAEKYIQSVRAIQEYKKTWEAAHPGEKFDIDDPGHEEFVAKNDLEYSEDDYVEALADIKAEESGKRTKEEVTKEIGEKLNKLDAREKARELAPKIIAHRATSAKILFNELGDDFKTVLDENGQINSEEVKRLCTVNEVYEPVFSIAQQVEEIAEEIFKLANGMTEIDEKNPSPVHRHILGFVSAQEARLKALPPDKQLDEKGRPFATGEEWEKMSKEERAKHWIFNHEQLSSIYASQQAARAKDLIKNEEDRLNRIAVQRGWKKPDTQNQVTQPPPPPPPKQPEISTTAPVVPKSPPGVIAPRIAPLNSPEKNQSPHLLQRIRGR